MGKISQRSTLVSPRRRLLKSSSGVGAKKNRNPSAKVCLPTPSPVHSMVDEDSGFGGDQSLDSDSSLLSAPGNSNSGVGVASISTLPSLAMVPQTDVYSQLSVDGSRLPVDISGDEAQELPGSLGCKNSRHIPPLISFKDVSLLSSIHSIRNNGNTGNTPVVRVEGPPPCVNRSRKILKQSSLIHSSPSLSSELSSVSSDGSIELKLITQPEEQHRARYQTEGSRGAVKDKDGKGHPTLKLVGYSKPTLVQIFVGDDSTKTRPHMFYQVCRVSGKNSTPCKEKRIEGTSVIEAKLDPDCDMTMSCDCVGILKERNVDVEHRFQAVVSRGRKKCTKCRLVFRTFVTLPNGTKETLQVVSRSIACTQPPGVPEICRRSLSSCLVSGGEELFIFGKNFAKDTVVIFQETGAKSQPIWEQTVVPEKETLQPIHMIVTVPKYYDEMITSEVTVQMIVSSGGKRSESHSFTYLPIISKKEIQDQETVEEKALPKGVSLGALQLNRHYAETRMLPPALQEVSPPTKSSHSLSKSAATPTKGMALSSLVPRVVQNSNINRKAGQRSLCSTSQVSKPAIAVKKGLASPVEHNVSLPSNVLDADSKVKSKDCKEKTPINDKKQEKTKGTVNLGSLVELLNLAQHSPNGTIEDLVKVMKEFMTAPSVTQVSINEKLSDATAQKNKTAGNVSFSRPLQEKVEKDLPNVSSQNSVTNKIIPSVTTNFGLWPLTLFPSVSTSQSVTSGPRVARVAPIAPTTVVSSPGLARAVRVCVTEAPHISLEPPKKKQCDYITPMEYEISERNPQLISQHGNTPISIPITTVSSGMTYNLRQTTPDNIITDHCNSRNTTSSPMTLNQESSVTQTSSQVGVEVPGLNSEVATTLNTQDPLFQNMDSSLLQTITNTTHQVDSQALNVDVPLNQATGITQPLNTSANQNLQQVTHSLSVSVNHVTQEDSQSMDMTLNQTQEESQPLNVSSAPPVPKLNQVVIKPEAEVLNHCNTSQEFKSTPIVVTSVPATIFNEHSGLETTRLVVTTNPGTLNKSPNCHTTSLASCSAASSSLAYSDPLLSQSVSPLQLGQNGTAQPPSRSQPSVEQRSRADILMTPSSTATQGSMQNEVTSAINLSETELLKFFDPNCFDNV